MGIYIRVLALLFAFPSILIACASLKGSETDTCKPYLPEVITCKPYTDKEIGLINASNNPRLVMGAGIISLVTNSSSTVGKELLELASRTEAPKGTATVSLIINQLNSNSVLKPLRENITQLLQDDKENALSYYLNALLQHEEGVDHKTLMLIKQGNTKNINAYPKQRFYAIVEAGEMAKCSRIQAQRHALWNSLNSGVYIKSRHLCKKLIEGYGQEAKSACFLMGQNLERASLTIVEKYNSLGIQRNALDDSPSNAPALAEIKKRRDLAVCDRRRIELIPYDDVTEEADLKYDEIYLESGECPALEFLSDFVKRKHRKN